MLGYGLHNPRRMDHEEAVYRSVDCLCLAAGGRWAGSGGDSEAGDFGADVLSVEEEVCRFGGSGSSSFEAVGGREQTAQADGGGLVVGQADAAGRVVKKALAPAVRREIVGEMLVCYGVSQRRACETLTFPRSTVRYESVADPQVAFRLRLHDLATSRVAYGYRRLYILLRREGWQVNHKRVYRLYREEDLAMRRKRPRRRVAAAVRELRPVASGVLE
jgi:putative transposase